ncbi:MAG: CHASE domain-containing protein [Colwellia sp.]|nr:CHASE domain-containing protein [Colwellia sp.]MCW8863902.1 CHASE domain-containing protein [Colwellia sp.]MCW9081184.1 CHASE domain-containing protein [Colwellia sp.]
MPFSFISFIGPVAGVTTALVIFMGTNILLVMSVAVIAFSSFLFWFMKLDINLAMIIITVLATMLQSYWAKQITLAQVNQQNWLKSRKELLTFLVKVGPLTAIVSASAIIVITMLDNKALGGNLFYTFMSSWSGSVLFAIFFTPLLLLTQRQQQLTSSKRFFIIFASSLAFVAIGLLFKISQNAQLHNRHDMFEQAKSDIGQSIRQEVALVVDELNSLSAFIKASEHVTSSEFKLFTEHNSHENSSIRVLEWAPIVQHAQRASYEKQAMRIMERDLAGKMQVAKQRDVYAPIRYVYPSLSNQIILGLDVLTNPAEVISMTKVINSDKAIASAPINLIQDDHSNPGILFILSVHAAGKLSNAPLITKQDSLLGFVVAVVQFEGFFTRIAELSTNDIGLFIEDISSVEPYILFGKQLLETNRYVEQFYLNVNSRQWRVSLFEQHPWQMQQKNWQAWGILFGVTFGGVLFQSLILMMAAYSSELSTQVIRKTQELIIAKDQSEQESVAKTAFLKTLNKELQTPLQAIALFIEQLRKTEQQQQKAIITNIDLAQKNMGQLLDMIVDLSKIESGNLLLQSEIFDFHGFLMRIDEMLKVQNQNTAKGRALTMLIDSSVPHFITGDELRIQQFLIPLCTDIYAFFNMKKIRLTVKSHSHQFNTATLFFVFTGHDEENIAVKAPCTDYMSKEIGQYSTQMTMVKEICQLMEGDLSLGVTHSGEMILTAVIKVVQATNEQQQAYQAHLFGDDETI